MTRSSAMGSRFIRNVVWFRTLSCRYWDKLWRHGTARWMGFQRACYHLELEQEVHYLGGGHTVSGYWVGVSKRRELEQELIRFLGEDGSGKSIKRIDVRIVGTAWNTSMEDNELSLFWKTVVWRPS